MSRVRIIEIEQEPKFKPFKLEITIESEEDLINLWHRMDLNNSEVANSFPKCGGTSVRLVSGINWKNSRINADIWEKLNERATDLKLRKHT